MNTENEKIAGRIYELKDWIVKHEKQYDNSKINEERVKKQIELEKLEERHIEDPFFKIGKNGVAANE